MRLASFPGRRQIPVSSGDRCSTWQPALAHAVWKRLWALDGTLVGLPVLPVQQLRLQCFPVELLFMFLFAGQSRALSSCRLPPAPSQSFLSVLAGPVLEFPSWKRTRLKLKCLTTEMRVMEPSLTACWGVQEIKGGSCVLSCFLNTSDKDAKKWDYSYFMKMLPLI